jgi:hypothetical protein
MSLTVVWQMQRLLFQGSTGSRSNEPRPGAGFLAGVISTVLPLNFVIAASWVTTRRSYDIARPAKMK